jgi:hypothetical protein
MAFSSEAILESQDGFSLLLAAAVWISAIETRMARLSCQIYDRWTLAAMAMSAPECDVDIEPRVLEHLHDVLSRHTISCVLGRYYLSR